MVDYSRRQFLSVAGAGLGLSGAGCVGALGGGSGSLPDGPTVSFERVAEGFTSPLGFETPAEVDRRYVVDQAGTIEGLSDGSVGDRPFLDVTDRTVEVGGYSERGLLGAAFHPEFPDEDRVFVRYSAPRREGTPSGYSHTFVLSEFSATPERADPGSERTVLEIPQPQSNHNSGAVVFGPEGYLYVGVGDGGGGGDRGRGHVADWYEANPGGNGQDVTDNLLGSVLRIDVDERSSSARRTASDDVDGDGGDGDRRYAIPEDNPLVGREGLDEQFAWGLRNPWRMSFHEGTLIVADVGQNAYEEVDVVESGGNYGWNVREGAHCFGADDCPDRTPADVRGGEPLRGPVVEYPRSVGIAVIGGYVYEGSAAPALAGEYVFGDWRGTDGDPTLLAATPSDEGLWSMERLSVEDGGDGGGPRQYLLAFGRDGDGELYVCTTGRSGVGGSTGAVHRLRSASGTDASPTEAGRSTTTRVTTGSGGTGATTGTGTETTTNGQPGFGFLAGLVGLGGAAAWVRRGRDGDGDGDPRTDS